MKYMPAKTESYLFLTGAGGSDAYKLIVDGKAVIDQLRARRPGAAIRRNFRSPRNSGLHRTRLLARRLLSPHWPRIRGVEELVTPEAKKIASIADAAFVAVGFDPPQRARASTDL